MRSVAEPGPGWPESPWLTTGETARLLHLSVEGVRWLVRDGQLTGERLRSRQLLFRLADVKRLAETRALARARRGGRVRLVSVGPRPPRAPRQLSLFGARLELVPVSVPRLEAKPVLRDRVVKRAAIGRVRR